MKVSPAALFAIPLLALACANTASPPAAPPPAAPEPKVEAPALTPAEAPPPAATLVSSPPPKADTKSHNVGPSCTGAKGAGNDCNGDSCCLRLDVPGGDFDMPLDDLGRTERVHVGSFSMDKYEVTVGRMRAWVRAGQPLPQDGAVLYDDGKGKVIRWSKANKVQTEKQLEGWKRYDTWTSDEERRPKNFVTWYTAAAFCHAEGGRLPTDAEWKYAVAGGDEKRPYPWGAEAPSPDFAVYNCMGDGDKSCSLKDILPVGSRQKGNGKWGHADLAGSMFEWTLDGGSAGGGGDNEIARGGGFCYIGGVDRRAKTGLRPGVLRRDTPDTVSHMVGVRCAYDLEHRT